MKIRVGDATYSISPIQKSVRKKPSWDAPEGEVFRGDRMLKALLTKQSTGKDVRYVTSDDRVVFVE